ncbi:MAG: hypothetical protein ACRCYY_00890 [Trueperaceae bacterium]
MNVSTTVAELANAVARHFPKLTSRQRLRLELLKLMPLYVDIHDLSCWERAFKETYPDKQARRSKAGRLIEDIFRLGEFNLYTAFDKQGTLEKYNALAKQLNAVGIKTKAIKAFKGW